MRPSRRPIVIATRQSRLALAQANAVANALRRLHPSIEVSLLPIESRGDQLRDHPLAQDGGKGLFTTTIEAALLRNQADVAVHSMKDLPVALTAGLVIAATPKRGDARDCLVTADGCALDDLPRGATVGTSSFRRITQLRRYRADLSFQPMRGNVDTRIDKVVKTNEYDAAVLAAAGLTRCGLGDQPHQPIATDVCVPAAGQAALAIQCRADDHVTLRRCLALNDSATSACVEAERAVLAALGADCHTAIGAYASVDTAGRVTLQARVLSPDGDEAVEAVATGPLRSVKRAIKSVINDLVDQGADDLLKAPAPA